MAHATLLTDNERINLYDGKYLILISHSAKNGQEEVRYNISGEKEDVKKLIFSKSGVIERADRLLKWFDSIF